MIKCGDCGKEFKTTQALGGHMRFVHGVRKDSQHPLFPPKHFVTREDYLKDFKVIMDAVTQLLKFKDEQSQLNKVHGEILEKLKERVLSQH